MEQPPVDMAQLIADYAKRIGIEHHSRHWCCGKEKVEEEAHECTNLQDELYAYMEANFKALHPKLPEIKNRKYMTFILLQLGALNRFVQSDVLLTHRAAVVRQSRQQEAALKRKAVEPEIPAKRRITTQLLTTEPPPAPSN